MDKETLSNYGWIVIAVMVLAVMIALATPFGTFVSSAIKSTTQGLFDVNQNALNSTGLINIEGQEFDKCDHDYEVTSSTVNCDTGGSTTHTCKLCGKSYTETTPAGHVFDNASDMKCNICNVSFTAYSFDPDDYDSKMGTTTATDAIVEIPETFEYNGTKYKTTSIASRAFYQHTWMEEIRIPNTVKSIKDRAFAYCSGLTTLYIPDSVTDLDDYCFNCCYGIETIYLSQNVTYIDMDSFSLCTSLKTITLHSNLKTIHDCAFYGSTKLETVNYTGTEEQWAQISIGGSNEPIKNQNLVINYNYTGK